MKELEGKVKPFYRQQQETNTQGFKALSQTSDNPFNWPSSTL